MDEKCPKCGKSSLPDSVRGLCSEHHFELMHEQVEEWIKIRAARTGKN